jgi:hypothetical protein
MSWPRSATRRPSGRPAGTSPSQISKRLALDKKSSGISRVAALKQYAKTGVGRKSVVKLCWTLLRDIKTGSARVEILNLLEFLQAPTSAEEAQRLAAEAKNPPPMTVADSPLLSPKTARPPAALGSPLLNSKFASVKALLAEPAEVVVPRGILDPEQKAYLAEADGDDWLDELTVEDPSPTAEVTVVETSTPPLQEEPGKVPTQAISVKTSGAGAEQPPLGHPDNFRKTEEPSKDALSVPSSAPTASGTPEFPLPVWPPRMGLPASDVQQAYAVLLRKAVSPGPEMELSRLIIRRDARMPSDDFLPQFCNLVLAYCLSTSNPALTLRTMRLPIRVSWDDGVGEPEPSIEADLLLNALHQRPREHWSYVPESENSSARWEVSTVVQRRPAPVDNGPTYQINFGDIRPSVSESVPKPRFYPDEFRGSQWHGDSSVRRRSIDERGLFNQRDTGM